MKRKKSFTHQLISYKFKKKTEANNLIKNNTSRYSNEIFNAVFLVHNNSFEKVVPEDFNSRSLSEIRTNVLNFNFFVNRSSTITVIFSSDFNLISMPKQQLNQSIPDAVIHTNNLFSKSLTTGVSFNI
jgi:hypothetical protein